MRSVVMEHMFENRCILPHGRSESPIYLFPQNYLLRPRSKKYPPKSKPEIKMLKNLL